MIRISAALLALLAGGVVACDSDDEQQRGPAPGPARAAPDGKAYAAPVPVGDADVPDPAEGRVVADSGFDRRRDAFSFENYGFSLGGPQMRAEELRELFGDRVCIEGGGRRCILTPDAERWRLQHNQSAIGGHCYGFSLLSVALRSGAADAGRYGATTAYDLRLADSNGLIVNAELHADLTRSAVMQHVPAVQETFKRYTPVELIAELRQGFSSGRSYVLGMFSPRPNEAGHAVTPIAVVDLGNGRFDVMLYDNNYPYRGDSPDSSDRRLRIDTTRNRWDYSLSPLPDIPEAQYFGQGTTNMITLVREEDQRLPQPCPFCAGAEARTTIGLSGDAARHGHLRITDSAGRVTGFDDGRLINTIPGAEVHRHLVSRIWLAEPEPQYSLPPGRNYTVELVDVPEDAPEATLHASGPGVGVGLSGLTADAGGSKLLLGPSGAVGLRPSDPGAVDGLLRVATSGDRELRIEPSAERLQLRRAAGDVLLSGRAESVTVLDPASGRSAPARSRTGRIDLDALVGTTP